MPAGLARDGKQNEPSTLYLLDFPFDDAKLRRVDYIIGRVDRQQRSFDFVKLWCGVVEPGRLHLVDDVVGVSLSGTVLLHHLDHALASGILLLQPKRTTGHQRLDVAD